MQDVSSPWNKNFWLFHLGLASYDDKLCVQCDPEKFLNGAQLQIWPTQPSANPDFNNTNSWFYRKERICICMAIAELWHFLESWLISRKQPAQNEPLRDARLPRPRARPPAPPRRVDAVRHRESWLWMNFCLKWWLLHTINMVRRIPKDIEAIA